MRDHRIARNVKVWAAAVLCVGLTSAPGAGAAELKQLDTSLKFVPADVAFYSSSLHLGQMLKDILESNAWKKIMEMPAVQIGQSVYQMQAAVPNTPLAKIKAAWENPQSRRAINFLASLLSEEVFMYGGSDVTDFFALALDIQKAMNYGPTLMLMAHRGQPSGGDATARIIMTALAEHADRIRVPEMVLGFKVRDVKEAAEHLALLETLAKATLDDLPQTKGRFQREKIGKGDFLTLSLEGKQFPLNELAQQLKDADIDQDDIKKLVARLKKLRLSIAVGLHDNYLLVYTGSDTKGLARLGQGKLLADVPVMRTLDKHADRPLTGLGYVSQALSQLVNNRNNYFLEMSDFLAELIEVAELSTADKKTVQAHLEELIGDIKGFVAKPAPQALVNLRSDKGLEGYGYALSDPYGLDGSKPLTLLEHTGGDPLLALVARGKSIAKEYDFFAKWVPKGYALVEQVALPAIEEEERAKVKDFVGQLRPLLAHLDEVNRKMLLPALADGQIGLVIDGKTTSKQPLVFLPASAEPLSLPLPAVIIGVSDAKLLRSAAGEYVTFINKLFEILQKVDPDNVPEFTFPEPTVEKTKAGEIHVFTLPDEMGIDGKIAPNVALGKDVAVLSLAPKQAEDLLAAKPLKLDGQSVDAKQPLAMAYYTNCAALSKTLRPWTKLAVRAIVEQIPGVGPAQGNAASAQVDALFDLLEVFRAMTSEFSLDGGTLVTHSTIVIRDLEKPSKPK